MPHLKALVERHKDAPFAIFGINTDTSENVFRRELENFGITWPNAYQDGTDGPVPTEWGIHTYPSIFVLDGKGVIRFRDKRGSELDEAVAQLLREMGESAPAPSSGAFVPDEPEPVDEGSAVIPAMPILPPGVGRSAPSKPAADPVDDVFEGARLSGRVVWTGPAVEPARELVIDGAQSAACCPTDHHIDTTDRSLLIGATGGVANVVVTVEVPGATPDAGAPPVVIDQSCCRFEPHVVALPIGGRVEFKNSDPVSHNIHTYARRNASMNRTVGSGSSAVTTYEKAEVVTVKCDIHPWMAGYVHVSESPFNAVTDASGAFHIDGLPSGEYTAEYWHEDKRVGKGKLTVNLSDGVASEALIEVGKQSTRGGRRRR